MKACSFLYESTCRNTANESLFFSERPELLHHQALDKQEVYLAMGAEKQKPVVCAAMEKIQNDVQDCSIPEQGKAGRSP